MESHKRLYRQRVIQECFLKVQVSNSDVLMAPMFPSLHHLRMRIFMLTERDFAQ